MAEPSKLVSLNVSESVFVLQDKVSMNANVLVEAPTREEVQKLLKEKATKVIAQLKKYKKVESFTVNQQISEKHKKVKNDYVVDGYKGIFIIGLLSYDFEAINIVYEELSDMVEFSHIETSVSSKLHKEKENELTEEAIAAFNKKAKLITESFEFSQYAIEDVSVSNTNPALGGLSYAASSLGGSMMRHENYSEEKEILVLIEPRQEKLSVSVSGKIKLIKTLVN